MYYYYTWFCSRSAALWMHSLDLENITRSSGYRRQHIKRLSNFTGSHSSLNNEGISLLKILNSISLILSSYLTSIFDLNLWENKLMYYTAPIFYPSFGHLGWHKFINMVHKDFLDTFLGSDLEGGYKHVRQAYQQ